MDKDRRVARDNIVRVQVTDSEVVGGGVGVEEVEVGLSDSWCGPTCDRRVAGVWRYLVFDCVVWGLSHPGW